MKKNKRSRTFNKKEIKVILSIIVLLFLIVLIVYVRNYRNFAEVKLNTNKKDIFTISDLKINDLKYSSSEDKVTEVFGKPKKIVNYSENGFRYKRFEYDDLSLTLREYYDDYILVGVETTSSKYKISRGLRVGSNISRVMNKYKVDNKSGSYLYGNYSYEEMSEKTDNVYMGIRTKLKVSYYNKDAKVENDTFPVDAIQKIEFEYKNGTVYKISWSYDYE
ncbi:MAG: hypothetical protein IKZ96_00985 [Bacilli bacterium]|nr:hypothetical protein [Bacilli bacterium]